MGMGLVALMGAAATVAGCSEDLESDIGSQSNPNSQVQLAAQVGYPHRIFNKAISGEPPSNAMYCAVGAGVAMVLIQSMSASPLLAIAVGAFVAALLNGVFSTTSYMGRNASQTRFNQYVYLDVLRNHILGIMGHAYITTFCIVGLSYVMWNQDLINHPFPFPVIAMIWGLAVGAIGSSTGDVHYGAEREFQDFKFGAGLNAADSGNITRYAEAGIRSSMDNAWFCSKFGGPATGIAFGMVVFLDNWRSTAFSGWISVAVGTAIVILLILYNRQIEIYARKKYGPYPEYSGDIEA
uniref:Tetrahydromethanopterin S-methyltransferase subunit E n=1 Tax=Candidatus Methanogaster sp. ANME-2c ERB4 TaxID=2759911 RepID=A0A7G9YH14_9EURY|nr:tetrahydromethanopterin S-methyltransferase subunit E [Methanosarcinales archaeon ANME-2c ERB4]